MKQILLDYFVTFGWALIGTLSMGVALAISLTIFSKLTGKLDEQAALKEGNIAVAIVIAAIIIGSSWVVSSIIRP